MVQEAKNIQEIQVVGTRFAANPELEHPEVSETEEMCQRTIDLLLE